MTLTPPRFHIADDMPMSLGKAIADSPPSTEVCKFKAFEKLRLGWVETKPGRWDTITEEDCRQIKGAVQVLRSESVQTQANQGTTPEAAPPSVQKFKPGDRVRAIASFGRWHAVGDVGVVLDTSPAFMVRFDPSDTTHKSLIEIGTATYPERFVLISPASETETEGWVEWKGGECPIPHAAPGKYELRFSDGDEFVSNIQIKWWDKLWSEETTSEKYWIVAYKVLA